MLNQQFSRGISEHYMNVNHHFYTFSFIWHMWFVKLWTHTKIKIKTKKTNFYQFSVSFLLLLLAFFCLHMETRFNALIHSIFILFCCFFFFFSFSSIFVLEWQSRTECAYKQNSWFDSHYKIFSELLSIVWARGFGIFLITKKSSSNVNVAQYVFFKNSKFFCVEQKNLILRQQVVLEVSSPSRWSVSK